jgi:hypothetical protein
MALHLWRSYSQFQIRYSNHSHSVRKLLARNSVVNLQIIYIYIYILCEICKSYKKNDVRRVISTVTQISVIVGKRPINQCTSISTGALMEKYKTDSNLLLQIGLIYVSRWTRTVKGTPQKLCFTYPSPITIVSISHLEAKTTFLMKDGMKDYPSLVTILYSSTLGAKVKD